jgi:hypothetical protein
MHENSSSWGEGCGKKSGTRKRPARGCLPIVDFRRILTVERLKYILVGFFAGSDATGSAFDHANGERKLSLTRCQNNANPDGSVFEGENCG